jgi:hypothetical protein
MEVAVRFLHRFVVLSLIVGGALFWSTPSYSDFLFKAPGWAGHPFYAKQGQFTSCIAATTDPNKYLILLKLQKDLKLSLGVGDFALSGHHGLLTRTYRIRLLGDPIALTVTEDVVARLERAPRLVGILNIAAVLDELKVCVRHSLLDHPGKSAPAIPETRMALPSPLTHTVRPVYRRER